jgi:hypothetical protein
MPGDEQTCPDPLRFRDACASQFKALGEARVFEEGSESSGAEALSGVLELVRTHEARGGAGGGGRKV